MSGDAGTAPLGRWGAAPSGRRLLGAWAGCCWPSGWTAAGGVGIAGRRPVARAAAVGRRGRGWALGGGGKGTIASSRYSPLPHTKLPFRARRRPPLPPMLILNLSLGGCYRCVQGGGWADSRAGARGGAATGGGASAAVGMPAPAGMGGGGGYRCGGAGCCCGGESAVRLGGHAAAVERGGLLLRRGRLVLQYSRGGGRGGCFSGAALPLGGRRLSWRFCWLVIDGQLLGRGPTVGVCGGFSGVGRLIARLRWLLPGWGRLLPGRGWLTVGVPSSCPLPRTGSSGPHTGSSHPSTLKQPPLHPEAAAPLAPQHPGNLLPWPWQRPLPLPGSSSCFPVTSLNSFAPNDWQSPPCPASSPHSSCSRRPTARCSSPPTGSSRPPALPPVASAARPAPAASTPGAATPRPVAAAPPELRPPPHQMQSPPWKHQPPLSGKQPPSQHHQPPRPR